VTGGLKGYLARHRGAKLTANHAYVYAVHLLHLLLDLTPWFVRGFVLRLLLGRMGRGVYFDHRVYIKFPWLVEIGDHASINRGAEFYPDFFQGHRIVLGNDVRVGPNARFHAAGHDISDLDYAHTGGTITVGDAVWIGAGALLLPGVTIGDRSVVGAGSVVTRDVPADSVAAGVPARVIRRREPEA
jgi:acetyltransferase-like isoleucine patch superfamily enzyme